MRLHILLCLAFFSALIPLDLTPADDPDPVKVNWSDDWRRMEFTFQGQSCLWPDDMVNTPFPPPGRPPEIATTSEWPVVTLKARWAIPIIRLEEKYRPQLRDLVLMYTCDAQLYEWAYPQIVRSSRYRCPKEFVAKANDPFGYDLAEALRGKLVSYQITATAGFAAPEYMIETKMRIGLSQDGKTVFFHDTPHQITANLKSRDYFVAFHLGEKNLEFEGRMYCVCTPRLLFRGEHMRRVELSGRYFINRLYKDFAEGASAKDVEEYLDLVKNQYVNLKELAEKYKIEEEQVLP
ncbi:MAG: hypothetical protein AB1696_23305 [Planctomycetota bacterium]